MDRSEAPRIALALMTVLFGIYMVATISAVQASLNIYASDMSGVLQLTVVACSTLAAGLLALALQHLDRLWMSVVELILYVVAALSAMAGFDSEVFLHRPVTLLYAALIWFAIGIVYYAVRLRAQWHESGQKMAQARRERELRAAERARKSSGSGEVPEWEDMSLPPPRV